MFKKLFSFTILKASPKELYALLFKLGFGIYLFIFVTNFFHLYTTFSMYGSSIVGFTFATGLELAAIYFSFSAIFIRNTTKNIILQFFSAPKLASFLTMFLVWFGNYYAMIYEKLKLSQSINISLIMDTGFRLDWVTLILSLYSPIVIGFMGHILGLYYSWYMNLKLKVN